MTHDTARMIAVRNDLIDTYVDRVDPNLKCPGFRLWHVTIEGDGHYLITADSHEHAAYTARVRAGVPSDRVTVNTCMGLNPDRETWEREWTALHYPTA